MRPPEVHVTPCPTKAQGGILSRPTSAAPAAPPPPPSHHPFHGVVVVSSEASGGKLKWRAFVCVCVCVVRSRGEGAGEVGKKGGTGGGAFGASWGSPDPSPARSCRLLGVAFRGGTWPIACLSHLDPRPDSRPDEPARVGVSGLPGAWGHLPGRGEKQIS